MLLYLSSGRLVYGSMFSPPSAEPILLDKMSGRIGPRTDTKSTANGHLTDPRAVRPYRSLLSLSWELVANDDAYTCSFLSQDSSMFLTLESFLGYALGIIGVCGNNI